ncbi:MAG: 3-hydroxyacyl-CoA dehydrogenase family protein [Candidatus Bathyarchaeota archaeon]
MEIRRVAVIGTGLMGHGIAQSFALNGYEVYLLSRSKASLENALKVIEWSLRKLVDKESIATPESIIASNTSTLSITEMGKVTERPEKTIGMHWFIPPQLTQLIEVIRGDETSNSTVSIIMDLSKKIGKTPILCKKDVRGFIVSRILVAAFNEAFWTYSRGEASMLEIDSSVKYSGGFPMGWFELVDYVGIDTEYDVSKILYNAHGERYSPCLELTEPLVKSNKLGRKTGVGFYNWNKSRPIIPLELKNKYDVGRSWAVAVNEAAYMIYEDVAAPESIDIGMKLGTGWPLGPCEYADEKGLDIILKTLQEAYDQYKIELYKPCILFEKYLKKGWKGKKTGKGFHSYK